MSLVVEPDGSCGIIHSLKLFFDRPENGKISNNKNYLLEHRSFLIRNLLQQYNRSSLDQFAISLDPGMMII